MLLDCEYGGVDDWWWLAVVASEY
uniref:Uncharacterized protein n=1 Tax=Rhizophora mucronata TaxID=61149 RepID=A0A2P2IHT8_RHIMU